MLKNEKLLKKEISELLEATKTGFSIEKWESAREFAYSLGWRDSFKEFVEEKVRNCSAEKLMEILKLIYDLDFENQSEITVKEIVTGSVYDVYSLFLTEGIIYYDKFLDDFTFEEFYESFHKGE
jgi:hypothetical protein